MFNLFTFNQLIHLVKCGVYVKDLKNFGNLTNKQLTRLLILNPKYINKLTINQQVKFLKHSPHYIQYIHYQSDELCNIVLSVNPYVIKHIWYHSDDRCLLAING